MEFPHSNLIFFLHELIPTLIALSLVVGASALWARSRRISALTQLVSSAGLLLVALVENLQSFALQYTESSLRTLWTSWPAEAKIAIGTLSAIVFSIAYLCHGIRSKSSKPDEAVNPESIPRRTP